MTWINVDESNDDNDDDGGEGEGGNNRSHAHAYACACACVVGVYTYMRSCMVVNFEKHVHVHDERRCCSAAGGRDSMSG